MPTCSDARVVSGVTLTAKADPCPGWISRSHPCTHLTEINNQRPDPLYEVYVYPNSDYSLLKIGGAVPQDDIAYHPVISSQAAKPNSFPLAALSSTHPGTTDQMSTMFEYYDSTQRTDTGWTGDKEEWDTSYELDVP